MVTFLVRNEDNPNSNFNCIASARKNARQIREVITTEMWEQLKDIYWSLQESPSYWLQPGQEKPRDIGAAAGAG